MGSTTLYEEALELLIKSIDEKWSDSYKKSINCNNPKGFSQKAHGAGRNKKGAPLMPRRQCLAPGPGATRHQCH